MATDKQLAANRANAQESTGPTTQHGKTISSMNALKPGLDIKSEFTRPESEADLTQLSAEYYADFTPANAIERALVDQLIRNEWLNRRYAAVDAAMWNKAFDDLETENPARAFFRNEDNMMKLDRLRNSAQRNYAKALKELMALRKARNAATPVREVTQPEPPTPELASFYTFPSQPADPTEADGETPPIAA